MNKRIKYQNYKKSIKWEWTNEIEIKLKKYWDDKYKIWELKYNFTSSEIGMWLMKY